MTINRWVPIGLLFVSSTVVVAAFNARAEARQDAGRDAGAGLAPELVQRLGLPGGGTGSHLPQRFAPTGGQIPAIGQPEILNSAGALSAALMTTVGGQNTQFSDVSLIADWDGREDMTADRSATVDDFSFVEPDPDFILTRTAISEHTIANGFDENVFYYGDSVGNVWVGVDSNDSDAQIEQVVQINLPTQLMAFGTLLGDDQVVITGLGVNPVADLTSFSNVNGSFCTFDGLVGEILYVAYMDTGGGLRLTSNNTIVRSGVIAFPIADLIAPDPTVACSNGTLPTALIAPTGFPVTVGTAFGVAFSVFHNFAGLAVDDDGSVYFQQVDLQQLTGANIVKVTDVGDNQDRALATSGFLTITTLNPAGGLYGTTSGPATQANRFTNYSGTSTTFGNVVSLAAGPSNVLYAALAKSDTGTNDPTEGVFAAPAIFAPAGLPSMVISFSDAVGAFDVCSGETANAVNVGGVLPVGNGIADVAIAGAVLAAGVNNFRVYVHGVGPDRRSTLPTNDPVMGNTENTLKLDFQADFTIHSGLVVDEGKKLFVISGGTPSGIGLNPSPRRTEILAFEDCCPEDRRGDYVDLRGNGFPNPPASGGNLGDGDSDRFDHIFQQAPVDGVSLMPTGLSGLARGFLRYTNRLAPNLISPGISLGSVVGVQGDDATDGPIVFELLDPGHQTAGGDDQNTPFRGDDNDGVGTTPLVGPLNGGFEFAFGGPVGTAGCVWNEFFLNSNGSISFGAGDTSNLADVLAFRSGAPKIAPAWTDLNPASRAGGALNTFPVHAIGFAGVNQFKVRWINVPEFGKEACGSRNTFSITLDDDGTSIDENANQPLNPANPIGNNAVPFDLQEGPNDLHFERDPVTGVIVGCPPRRSGSGNFHFLYARMDLLGTLARQVLTGYSIGGLAQTNPPGMCEINLSEASRAADAETFGVIQGQTASIMKCLLGEGTEPTLFELFDGGSDASLVPGTGNILVAKPDFDLRDEGNDPALTKPVGQTDFNQGEVNFFGVGCAPPALPSCQTVVPELPVNVAPNQPPVTGPTVKGIINALCEADITIVGCGILPNELTTICQGVVSDGQVQRERPGKTVTTAVTLGCDSNGDGIPESVFALGQVTPLSENSLRATLLPQTAAGFPGTPFPLSCCGGSAVLTVTTTFTSGDNNIFGPFTRTFTCSVDLGVRAPVVLSASPSDGNCSNLQDLVITGSCFVSNAGPITRVFAVEFDQATQTLNYANTIDALAFVVLNNNLIDATFDIGAENAGKKFMIFVTGPGGTSRNLTQGETPVGCVYGNEQGIQVLFGCDGQQNQPPVAYCKNYYKYVTHYGTYPVSPSDIDNGSYDPDGDPITLSLNPPGPFPIGTTPVTLTVTDSHGASSTCQATVTIQYGSAPATVTILAQDFTASEANSDTGRYRVSRVGGTTSSPLVVSYSLGGSATNGSDYTSLPGTVTIPAGQTGVNITVRPNNDTVSECTENVVATLTGGPGYVIGSQGSATVTISDNDLPTVTIVATDASASEPGSNGGVFTITRTGCTDASLTVFGAVSGTATASSDYVALTGPATIPAGQSSVTIAITPIDNAVAEPSETVIVTISNRPTYIVGTPKTATVTITDND